MCSAFPVFLPELAALPRVFVQEEDHLQAGTKAQVWTSHGYFAGNVRAGGITGRVSTLIDTPFAFVGATAGGVDLRTILSVLVDEGYKACMAWAKALSLQTSSRAGTLKSPTSHIAVLFCPLRLLLRRYSSVRDLDSAHTRSLSDAPFFRKQDSLPPSCAPDL